LRKRARNRSEAAIIEVKTKYTKEAYKKFQWFYFFKAGLTGVIFKDLLVFLFLGGAFLLSIYFIFADSLSVSSLVTGIVCIWLVITFLLFPKISANSAYKKSPSLFETGIMFSFSDEFFSVTTTGNEISGTNDIKYTAMFKAVELRDLFYLFLQPSQAYLLDKKDFTRGTPEELSALLAKVLPEKKFKKHVR